MADSEELESIPFVDFGNDELADAPRVRDGDVIECDLCGGEHSLEKSMSESGAMSMHFYKCGEKTYLAAIDGKNVSGILKTRRSENKEAAT